MKSIKILAGLLASVTILASSVSAQLFSEGFDSNAADVTINVQSADTGVSFVDYSNLSRGASTFNIPEAPRMVAGSAATSGILLEANLVDGSAAAVNVLAGATPLNLSGSYRVSFDAYLSLNNNPFPSGSTEQLVWGVGDDNTPPVLGRNTRASGVGTFGWLAGENGYGTEDAAIFENSTELFDLGDTQGPQILWPNGENEPFDAAFPCNADGTPSTPDATPPNGAPMNDWVQVDIDVRDNGDGTSNVGVFFNFVEFFNANVANASVTGAALLGYEDPFGSSVNSDPDNTFGLFDNFVITANPTGAPMGTIPEPTNCVIPEPSTGLLCLFSLIAALGMRPRR